MYFTHYKNDKKLYEISLSIKAFVPITNKDKERINKIAILLGSLGYDKDITESDYRFRTEMENEELLLDIEEVSLESEHKSKE